jgi:hypothetical protein
MESPCADLNTVNINMNAKEQKVIHMKSNSHSAACAVLLLWGAAIAGLAGTANCPTCSDKLFQWVINPTHYLTYDSPHLFCQDPPKSDFECLTSSEYTAPETYYHHIWDEVQHEWDTFGPWHANYNPCFNDDTECWRDS